MSGLASPRPGTAIGGEVTESCICGNVIREDAPCRIRVRPCRCSLPGPAKAPPLLLYTQNVTKQQYYERKSLGLPLRTDFELCEEFRDGS
jgi:hypothetical protein